MTNAAVSINTMTVYLLSIRGTLLPATLEEARQVHNMTAGNPAGVEAAKSLGDLSHMVHVPIGTADAGASEFLILDQWNNLEGLNTFFADKQVQDGGSMIFTSRDPVVWMPAEGFTSFHFPSPTEKKERIVGVIRGTVKSHDEARMIHNELIGSTTNAARRAGIVSHEIYFRVAAPGSPEGLELLGVDVWHDSAGMAAYYDTPDLMANLGRMFAGRPDATTWVRPAGDWTEW
jgi:hypothetical protein